MTELAYLTDPLTLEFSARIMHKEVIDAGTADIWLDRTYFYPTGGGQQHDTGFLDRFQVFDVFKDDNDHVVHRIVGNPIGPHVTGQIDAIRRRGHMQHHSAQHILSAAMFSAFELNTLSAKISADAPSTIDVLDAELSWANLAHVERLANEVVFDNRPIKSYFISDADIAAVPFRRPPKVSGQIRVVEVVDFDFSACGGTHCPMAGMIGTIKIVKTERQNKKLRIYFVAGVQALTCFQQYFQVTTKIANELSSSVDDLAQLVRAQAVQLKHLQKELRRRQDDLLPLEVEKLTALSAQLDNVRLVTAIFHDKPASELRELAKLLQQRAGLVALLAGIDQDKLALVVSCAGDTGLNARDLLLHQLAAVGGRGGGNSGLAQGGGTIDADQVATFFETTPGLITELLAVTK